jgi:hypothetical protein
VRDVFWEDRNSFTFSHTGLRTSPLINFFSLNKRFDKTALTSRWQTFVPAKFRFMPLMAFDRFDLYYCPSGKNIGVWDNPPERGQSVSQVIPLLFVPLIHEWLGLNL